MSPDRVVVAGVAVDRIDSEGARTWFREAVRSRPRPGVRACTANADFLVIARHDSIFRGVLNTADLTMADGAPVVWLARLAGQPLPGRVAGADLVAWVIDGGIPALRLYLIGSTDAVCRAVSARAAVAGVQVVGWNAASREVLDDPAGAQSIVEAINAAEPDVLFVALGAPRQDLWLAKHQAALRVSAMMGVGGSLDLAAGRLRRAPKVLQATGLEWLFRLVQEPRRLWRRYLRDDLPFLLREIPAALRRRA